MKLYQSEKTGSLYFLDGTDLMQAPMNSSDGLIDLENAAVVDWDFVALEPSDDPENMTEYLRKIEKELKA